MTAHMINSTVRSTVNTQGLTKNVLYVVVDIDRQPFGVVVYVVQDKGNEQAPKLPVVNGSLLLAKVEK